MQTLCVLSLFIYSLYYLQKLFPLTRENIIIIILYISFASVPNLYFILDGFEKYKKVPKSSIHEVLLTTFHRKEQKSLGFWVFFDVLQWVLQLSLKQMMTQVFENLVIYGTNVWNRFDRGSLDNPPVHLFFASALANVFECSGLKPFLFRIASFTKSTMLELGTIEPSKTNCPLSFHLMTSE